MLGTKHDENKVRMDLIPPLPLQTIAEVFGVQANKYDEYKWDKGLEYSMLYSSAQRHLTSYWGGEIFDPETGISHVAHAVYNLLMIMDMEEIDHHDEKIKGRINYG